MPDETGRTDRTTLTDEELRGIADFPNYREAGPMAREIIALRLEAKRAASDIQAAQDALTLERRRCQVLHKDMEFKCAGCGSHTELGRGRGYICFCCPTSSFCHECAKGHFAGHDNAPPAKGELTVECCGCGKRFPMHLANTLTPDPDSGPICPECCTPPPDVAPQDREQARALLGALAGEKTCLGYAGPTEHDPNVGAYEIGKLHNAVATALAKQRERIIAKISNMTFGGHSIPVGDAIIAMLKEDAGA